MVSLRRELVYSLLLAIGLLLAGLAALLWVANTREQHYQDELNDLRRSLLIRDMEILQLRRRLQQPIPTPDSALANWPADTASATRLH